MSLHPLRISISITHFSCSGGSAEPVLTRRHVRQGIERIQKASGKQDVPSGWYLGRGSLYSKHVISKVSLSTPAGGCS